MNEALPHSQALLAALIDNDPDFVETLADDDPRKASGVAVGNLVTQTVGGLRDLFPNRWINDLMGIVWDIIGRRIVPAAVGPTATPSMAVHGYKAIILLPQTWPAMMAQDPIMQVGAMVFVGSQARDFHRGLIRSIAGSEMAKMRAKAYEAEYLKTCLSLSIGSPTFNEYQREVLAMFPNGLTSRPDLAYESGRFQLNIA